MIWLRLKTRSGSPASSASSLNSDGVSTVVVPSTTTSCAREVDAQAADLLHGGAGRGAVELAPAQQRAHAAHELGDRERLGDVVVGAELEAEHAVDLGVARRQHDDRHVRLGAQRRGRPRCPRAAAASRRAARRRSARRARGPSAALAVGGDLDLEAVLAAARS